VLTLHALWLSLAHTCTVNTLYSTMATSAAAAAAVAQRLSDAVDTMLATQCHVFFAGARSGYKMGGRGALTITFLNIEAFEGPGHAWAYAYRAELAKLELPPAVLHAVDSYNPETHFMVLAVLAMSKVDTDRCKRVIVSRCRAASFKCDGPGCTVTENLKTCSGCNEAMYCSVACQRAHRSDHKRNCLSVDTQKTKLQAFYGSQM
jgi:MYND finger